MAAFDAAEIAGVEGSVAALWLHDRRGYTARPALRLQRLGTEARWAGAVEETLAADGGETLITLDGIRVDSFAVGASRHRHTVDDDGFGVALAKARAAEAAKHGSAAFMAWVRAFNHDQAKPAMAGAPDPRVEAAERLSSYDYTTPALLLLADNPAIAGLRFDVLASLLWSEDRFDDDHFDRLADLLATRRFDRRYGVPHELVGIGRRMLRGAVEAHAWTRFDLQSRHRGRAASIREGRYLVTPAEHGDTPPALAVIRMDAGLTFGGGDHPSSYLCLRALEWLARFRQFKCILDVGTGSGLLSIAALKTWPARATALEVNPFVAANHVAPRVRVGCDIGAKPHRLPRGTRFELALANLNDSELAAYAPALARAAAPGAMIVLSGLGNYRERYVAGAYQARGLELSKVFRQDGWSALIMQAPRAGRLGRQTKTTRLPLRPRPAIGGTHKDPTKRHTPRNASLAFRQARLRVRVNTR